MNERNKDTENSIMPSIDIILTDIVEHSTPIQQNTYSF